MGDSKMGLHARLMSQALRKLTGTISKTNCTVFFINQLREKIGVMFGNPETTTGGNALKFYASVRLDIRRSTQIKDGDNVLGNRTKVKVVKNTLLQKAMEQLDGVDFSEMFDTFKGNSALMISETANGPAKLIKSFRKAAAIPALKSAYLQETFYLGDENLDALSNIKSKEEMVGEIIGLLQSPIKRLISALENKHEGAAEAGTEETETPAAE